ncbi:hypothetical protein LCGC14_1320860 [marine sediment metagenome]|uniref:Uncharacterized protein n=1 Tax=marine sediment metagenome TaxID=412755 RepID=A0A0F9L4Y9_9ZZZZ
MPSRPVNRKFETWEIPVDGVKYLVAVRFLSEASGANPTFTASCQDLDANVKSDNLVELYESIRAIVLDRGSILWEPYVVIQVDTGGYGASVDFHAYAVGIQKDGRTAYVNRALPQYFLDNKVSIEDVAVTKFLATTFPHVQYNDPSKERIGYGPTRRMALVPYDAETISLCRRLRAIVVQAREDLNDLLPQQQGVTA